MKRNKLGFRTKAVAVGLSMILLGYLTSNSGLIVQGFFTAEQAVLTRSVIENGPDSGVAE